MIAKKSLREIRASLKDACQQVPVDPDEWFDEQLQKLHSKVTPSPHEVETLTLIRDGLIEKSPASKKARQGRPRAAAAH